MAHEIIYKAYKKHDGNTTDTYYAFDMGTAKAKIRNVVSLDEPADWQPAGEDHQDKWELQNPSDHRVTVGIKTVLVYGDPEQLLESE